MAAFTVSRETDEDIRLRGFLLRDPGTCRIYFDTPTTRDRPPHGIDLPLRDRHGTPAGSGTGAAAALPVLLTDGDLERMRNTTERDPYCTDLFDMTDWLSED